MPGVVSGITGAIGAADQEDEAKKQLAAAQAARDAGVAQARGLDWSPERVSDQVGTYQRSRSPVADAFLQSFLTGDNPAAIQGTRLGAKIDKADAGRRFNTNFGGWDALRAKQRDIEASTPWKIQAPAGSTYDEKRAGADNKLSPDEQKKLTELGGGILVNADGTLAGVKPGVHQLNTKPYYQAVGFDAKPNDPATIGRLRRYLKLLEQGVDLPTAAAQSAYDLAGDGGS